MKYVKPDLKVVNLICKNVIALSLHGTNEEALTNYLENPFEEGEEESWK